MAVVGEEELLAIPFRWFVYVVAGLPLLALFACIALSIALHLDEATRTHCEVANWLPSISAAVAAFSPERYIWRVLIALHSAPRYIIAFAFRNLLLTSPLRPLTGQTWFRLVCHLACAINVAENTFLLLLTSVSSTENYLLHKSSFGGFALCAMVYMFITTWLFHYSGRRRTSSLLHMAHVHSCSRSYTQVPHSQLHIAQFKAAVKDIHKYPIHDYIRHMSKAGAEDVNKPQHMEFLQIAVTHLQRTNR
ncbi:Post-GPI attachment to proteins factor 2 [Toxocara canis]|uniref:Post-GPI attachment to proteins factor 2 n=1 Tax=Toxocara canis TaxID=6265 RepID=A0A0B2VD47_TOXCA|nr:Post-GPI attachment to proteins factor 2 [Toxocara canis]